MEDYKIIREVGRGGMGCVYEAEDAFGRKIALKMMSAKAAAHPDYRDMFEHEVTALKRLDSSSVVRIVGRPFSDADGNLFLPMEFVEGKTITQIVKENGPFSEKDAISVFVKLLDAFSHIHEKGCIHRDVKPSNIMIRPDNSVCVIDFGIAKDSRTSSGKTVGRIVGTDGYMSPEQADGLNIDTRTDIYSLGCLLHYMLTGTHAIPKKSNDYETICAILENNFPLVKDKGIFVSDKTQDAILKAVNKNMTLRFQTVEEFKAALTDISVHKISIGRTNCDILMSGEYVSGHHLDIIWEQLSDDGNTNRVTIKDHSTNGTGVNGRKIRNTAYSFTVTKSVKTLMNDNSQLPQVMIAGLPDYILDWHDVLNILFEKLDLSTTSIIGDVKNIAELEEELRNPPKEKDLPILLGIICFLFPIMGWILALVWKNSHPAKSSTANIVATCGFILNFIILLFL